jgi:hypothetical protein
VQAPFSKQIPDDLLGVRLRRIFTPSFYPASARRIVTPTTVRSDLLHELNFNSPEFVPRMFWGFWSANFLERSPPNFSFAGRSPAFAARQGR